jgi:hypothetical protein
MMKVICSDIRWDTDGQEIDDLPTELTVEVLEVENVGDALSDETGWCHFGFHQQIVYHGYEIVNEGTYSLYVDTDENAYNARLAEELSHDHHETYRIGTVKADSIEEALDKIRQDDWEWTQKV